MESLWFEDNIRGNNLYIWNVNKFNLSILSSNTFLGLPKEVTYVQIHSNIIEAIQSRAFHDMEHVTDLIIRGYVSHST